MRPSAIGRLDAQDGTGYCPEAYFMRISDKIAYTRGFIAAGGEDISARALLAASVNFVAPEVA